jgi:hypothetical protein
MNLSDISAIQIECANQVAAQAPDRFTPTENLIFRPASFDPDVLAVDIHDEDGLRRFVVRYNPVDDYDVMLVQWPEKVAGEAPREWKGVYCDDLGGIMFGDEAKDFVPEIRVI